jgi:hypothetical protein
MKSLICYEGIKASKILEELGRTVLLGEAMDGESSLRLG